MLQQDINTGTRRRLLIAAPGVVALVLATRERGRAKSSLAKFRKRQKARAKAEALDAMVPELTDLGASIAQIQGFASTLQSIPGLESLGSDLADIASDIIAIRTRLIDNLAIARGVAT